MNKLTNFLLFHLIINELSHSFVLLWCHKSEDEGARVPLGDLDIFPQRRVLLVVDVLFNSFDNAVARLACGLGGTLVG